MQAPPIYESFRYIHKPDHQHRSDQVLENKYSCVEALGDRFIVYANGIGYRVYRNRGDYEEHFEMMKPDEKVFNEVILDVEQKLKFDIDSPVEKLHQFTIPIEEDEPDSQLQFVGAVQDPEIAALLDSIDVECDQPKADTVDPIAAKYDHIREVILRTIKDTFFMAYSIDLKSEHIIICESKDESMNVRKYSNHIIIDGFKVSGYVQAREFTRRVNAYLSEPYRTFLDVGVNKKIQNFRLVGCHKTDDTRVKKVVSEHHPSRTFITNVDDCIGLPDIATKEIKNFRNELHPDDVKNVLAICKQNGINDHKYNFNLNGMFVFTRTHGSFCDFCKRNHDSDNTLLITTSTNDGVTAVFRQCRKYIDEHGKDGNHVVVIGEFPSNSSGIEINSEKDLKVNEGRIGRWTDRTITRKLARSNDPVQQLLFDSLPAGLKNIYNEPTLRPFELTHTLVVHAMMKMGKTKTLREYINKHFADGISQKIIRFVSFRQTFSGNIKEKFPDFTLYSDVKGLLNQSKLIVQVESLHRLDIQFGDESPDLLILDECESIFEQFHAGLTNNFECFSKFQYLMKNSKHVICMDANISDRTFRILRQMRPGFASNNQIVYHCNRYKNACDDNYYVTGDKLKWLGVLYASIEADERIAVPMSSLAEAKILEKNLTKKYPQKSVKLYSSETKQSEKNEHFKDVNTFWCNYDILIYTPTVSAGVSFEQKHFKKVFGYFTDQSCPVETCVQMIGRIRDVSDHKFYICVCATGNNLPTDIDAIREQVINKRENLFNNYDETGLIVTYEPNGERKVAPVCGDYFHMWLENTRVKNISKNSFIQRFIDVISTTGAHVNQLSDEVFNECTGLEMTIEGELNTALAEIQIAHGMAKAEIREEANKKIAGARDLDPQELEDIHNAMTSQQDIADDTYYAYEKHRLRTDYKFSGTIDEKFVDRYRDQKVKRVYKNLSRIVGYDSIDAALKQIQAEERANYVFMMEMGEKSQHQDLNRKYVFDQHRYALGLLKLCGWTGIEDPKFINKVLIAHELRNNEKVYWENIKSACNEFGIKCPSVQVVTMNKQNDDKLIELMLKPINKILSIMYGVNVGTRKNDPDMFFIMQNNMFTTDADTSKKKNIPLLTTVRKTFTIDS